MLNATIVSLAQAQPALTDQTAPYVVVLGIAQDAGYPQAGCKKACCAQAWANPELKRHPASLAIIDPASAERWIIDATPDLPEQLRMLDSIAPVATPPILHGILLTHAHMGHYTGLLHLGREVMGTQGIPVHAMPRMREYLSKNGPWELLLRLGHIQLHPLEQQTPTQLNARLTVTPLLVPHRDEYTETVGFHIQGPNHSIFYLPDIDKWEAWDKAGGSIEQAIQNCDRAYLDGTFYANGEIPGRDMSTIPHPFLEESLKRFAALPEPERSKVRFLHFNHTNPALQKDSEARARLEAAHMHVAEELERFGL